MSSKFFTWTKGDRRNVPDVLSSPGAVSHDMDYARTEKDSNKANRKPAPLVLDSKSASPSHSNRTTNSIALHDAAVKSATSLLCVMNDMFSSPHLSAHLRASQTQTAGFLPLPKRPRAYTAPSTPLVEAPMMGLVELPGSLPQDSKYNVSLYPPIADGVDDLPPSLIIGEKIDRPRTSPQDETHILPNRRARMSVESFYRDEAFSPVTQTSPLSKSCSPRRNLDASLVSCDEGEMPNHQDKSSTTATIRAPSPFIVQSVPPSASSLAPPFSLSSSQRGNASLPSDRIQQIDAESILIDQISDMRSSHETQVRSLKEAYEKEIASHQQYVAFLENRQRLLQLGFSGRGTQTLTLDTYQNSEIGTESLNSHTSASTAQSQESSVDSQAGRSLETGAGVEALKRKLSLYRKAQEDTAELRRERDQLRNVAGGNDRRILQLKEIVRKAKETEKSLRNTVENLEGRLAASNNERIDVLEGFNEASERVRTLSERERLLSQELEGLRNHHSIPEEHLAPGCEAPPTPPPKDMTSPALRPRHNRTYSDLGAISGKGHPLLQETRDLRQVLAEKDERIRQLEEASADKSDSQSTHLARIAELEQNFEKQQQLLAAAKAESERYNSLLHSELRRQARHAAEKKPVTASGAFAVAAEKMIRLRARSETVPLSTTTGGTNASEESEYSIALLEGELEHCISEMISYKSSMRGLKKDLRAADEKIESLQQAMNTPRPPTPDKSPVSVRSHSSVDTQTRSSASDASEPLQPGLGISMPAKIVSCGTPEKASAMSLPSQACAVSSPPASRSKTPLGIHKRLPKPPPSQQPHGTTPSLAPSRMKAPLPAEAVRSFSESVIASHTKRETSNEGTSGVAAAKEPSSEPLGTIDTPTPPLSKFSLGQTPRTGQTA